MTNDPCKKEPQAKAEVRQEFTKQVDQTTQAGENVGKAATNQEQRKQHAVDTKEWDGDVNNVEDMGKAFDRTEQQEDMSASISDGDAPGVVGDLILSSMIGDYMATMERAFRARHLSTVRRKLHAGARRSGHGSKNGLFGRSVIGVLADISRKSKDV